ncbi:MAG: PilW family protein [Gammaproteobacteria bacterium]
MRPSSRRHQSGFTLVEFAIASGLGLVLLAGLANIFAATKKTYQVNEAISRMQDDGRFAMDMMMTHLRLAGRMAVAPITSQTSSSGVVFGAVGTSDPPVNGTLSSTSQLAVNIRGYYEEGDGDNAVLCDGSGIDALNLTLDPIQTVRFYMDNASANTDFTLYCAVSGGTAVPLINGVSGLSFAYGQDTDGDNDPNYFVGFSTITSASQVVAVKISMTIKDMVQGGDPIPDKTFYGTVNFLVQP